MISLKDRLNEILLQDNLISLTDLDKALSEQKNSGGDLGKILVKNKAIDEDTLLHAVSVGLGLPPINITRIKIDPSVLEVIPYNIAERYMIMPISLIGDTLTLAMADPLNIFVIDNIKSITGMVINPIVGREEDVKKAIEKYYVNRSEDEGSSQAFADIVHDIKEKEEAEVVAVGAVEIKKGAIEELKDDAPIVKLTDTILQQAVSAKASDIFIEPLEDTLRIRYRIDGVIREVDRMSKVLSFPLVSRIKVISNLDIAERRLPQDGRFRIIVGGHQEVDFRVSVLPTALGEKVVLRILDKSGGILDVDTLGFEAGSLIRLKECFAKPHGLILACGPTGSGKTTTLYSILKSLDSPEKNLVTVEDPVEFQMKGLNQVNVKPSLGLTFSSSLRSILRQDPDVILIGEIRDAETLNIAVKAALTGHLVLSSLHTTTAPGSIIRMMNMGVEPFLICSSVLAIVAQRLLRRVCLKCKEKYVVSDAVKKKVGLDLVVDNQEITLYRGKGCNDCFSTGYKGRVGITEILVLTPRLKESILKRVGEVKIKEIARMDGMKTMREDGFAKALEGLTSLEEVIRITAPDDALPVSPQ